jgi:uncharacterized protein YutE (UPF0331/DUF86 family)
VTKSPIDLKIVTGRLELIHRHLEDLRSLPIESLGHFLSDRRNPLAAEALLRRALDALLDTTRHLLAKGHSRAALEYKEAAQLASELGLVQDAELAGRFRELAGYRNRLTQHYADLTPEEIFAIVSGHLDDLEALADELRRAAARLASGS